MTHISVDYENFLISVAASKCIQHPRIVFSFEILPGFSVPESTLLELWEQESWRTLCCLVRARVCCLLSACFHSPSAAASQLLFIFFQSGDVKRWTP